MITFRSLGSSTNRSITPVAAATYRRWLMPTLAVCLGAHLGAASAVHAADVNRLSAASATATGSGSAGIPTLTSFSIPAGKNRVLFIWPAFERDHVSDADATAGYGSNSNTAGTGLGDNWPEARVGTPPSTTSTNQVTARVVGPGGTIDKKNALTVGGTPSGDTRYITISVAPAGSPAGTALFSLNSFHIVLFETEIDALLGGAASGTVTITLPDVTTPSNAGDDASLAAVVFENVEQTPAGFVRNGTATAQVTSGTSGNATLSPAAYDAAQSPDESGDGKLVIGFSSDTAGFALPTDMSPSRPARPRTSAATTTQPTETPTTSPTAPPTASSSATEESRLEASTPCRSLEPPRR